MPDDNRAPIAAAPKAAEPKPAPAPDNPLVDRWFRELVCNSVAAHDTVGFNHLAEVAVPELKRRLAAAG